MLGCLLVQVFVFGPQPSSSSQPKLCGFSPHFWAPSGPSSSPKKQPIYPADEQHPWVPREPQHADTEPHQSRDIWFKNAHDAWVTVVAAVQQFATVSISASAGHSQREVLAVIAPVQLRLFSSHWFLLLALCDVTDKSKTVGHADPAIQIWVKQPIWASVRGVQHLGADTTVQLWVESTPRRVRAVLSSTWDQHNITQLVILLKMDRPANHKAKA